SGIPRTRISTPRNPSSEPSRSVFARTECGIPSRRPHVGGVRMHPRVRAERTPRPYDGASAMTTPLPRPSAAREIFTPMQTLQEDLDLREPAEGISFDPASARTNEGGPFRPVQFLGAK